MMSLSFTAVLAAVCLIGAVILATIDPDHAKIVGRLIMCLLLVCLAIYFAAKA